MVGNGVTDTQFDGDALVPFAHGMGLISNDIYEVWHFSGCKLQIFLCQKQEKCRVALPSYPVVSICEYWVFW